MQCVYFVNFYLLLSNKNCALSPLRALPVISGKFQGHARSECIISQVPQLKNSIPSIALKLSEYVHYSTVINRQIHWPKLPPLSN